MKKKLYINGMSCMHCVKRAKNALLEIEGVQEAEVDLDGKFAVVEFSENVSDELLKNAVEEAGYEVSAVE